MKRVVNVARATVHLLWLCFSLPFAIIKRFKVNSAYDKYLRAKYVQGKSTHNTARTYDRFLVSQDFKDLEDKFYRKMYANYGKESH